MLLILPKSINPQMARIDTESRYEHELDIGALIWYRDRR